MGIQSYRSSTIAPRQLLLRCPTTVLPVHMHCPTTVHPWTYAHTPYYDDQVGNIDIEVCDICAKKTKVIACIEDPAVIKKILAQLKVQTPATIKYVIPEGRSPPKSSLFAD